MFSGHDPNGDNLNQFVNFGIAAAAAAGSIGPIDWATLAQQWIQMRDHSVVNDINYNQTAMPEAPPPPLISGGGGGQVDHGKMKTYEEQGEADMDMDDDVQQQQHQHQQQQQQQAIQDNSWLSEPIPPAPQWNAWAASTPVPMFQNSGAGVPMLRPPVGVNTMPLPGNTHAQIPSLLKMSVHHPPHMMKQIPPHAFPTAPPPIVDPSQSMPVIDAAKRKVLPAWIREGLEKMERDKLKQLEKEQLKQNESSSENDKENGADLELAREIIETDKEIISSNMVKSKYTHANLTSDEEQENSGNEVELETTIHNNDDDQDQDDDDDEDKQQLNVVKSYEDKIAEMMMVVRRTLTELLLDVTNTEILNIAQETLKSQQAKASSAQVISKSALSSITGKLGLAVYGDSSSGESSEDEEELTTNRQSSNNDVDSEEELKRIIRMKKREFERTADEIEDEIAAAAELEEKRFKLHAQKEAQVERRNKMKNSEDGSNSTRNMGKGFVDQEFGETTSDSKLPYLNGKDKQQRERLMRKERTTRFSDSREPKTVSLAAAAKYFSQLQQQQQQQQQHQQQQQQQNMLMTTAEYDAGTSGTGTSGLNNMLNAAEAALKKASKAAESSKLKSSVEHNQRVTSKHERQHKRSRSRSRSTNSSTSSSKTNSYTSSMSDRRHHKKHRSKDKRKEKQRRRERRSSSRSRSTSRSSDEDSRRKHRRRSRSRSRSRSSYRKRSSSRDYDRHSKHHKERSTSSSYSRSSRSHSTHYSRHKH